MNVTIHIKGSAGTATGAGVYDPGTAVELTAIPASVTEFKHWIDNGDIITSNPYSFTAEEDKTIDLYFFMPVRNYLKNSIGYSITDEQLIAVMSRRNIPYGADLNEVSEKQKELAKADLIMLIVTSQSEGADEDTMGNWSHKGKSKSITGRKELISLAQSIYAKYGITVSSNRIKDISNKW